MEIKCNDLDLYKALEQIEDYMKRVVMRRVTLGHLQMSVLGLLVLGVFSVHMFTDWDLETKKVRHTFWDRDR